MNPQTKLPLNHVQAMVIDMDGVLWRGDTLLPGMHRFFEHLRRRNIPIMLASNNTRKTPAQYVARLAGFDVVVEPQEVLTAAIATAEYMQQRYPPGTRVYVVGEDGIRNSLTQAGFEITEENVEVVVVGLDMSVTYDKLKIATLAIFHGADYIGTNPDVNIPLEGGLGPGNGSILAAISAATGKTPLIVGKPERTLFDIALRRLKTDPDHTAMIGDRLGTDILGGQRAGLRTILVLTGVSTAEELAASEVQPTWTFPDLDTMLDAWEA